MPHLLVTLYNSFALMNILFPTDFNCSAGCGLAEVNFGVCLIPWTEDPILKMLVSPDAFINHSQHMKWCVLYWLSNVVRIKKNKTKKTYYLLLKDSNPDFSISPRFKTLYWQNKIFPHVQILLLFELYNNFAVSLNDPSKQNFKFNICKVMYKI